MAGYSGGRKVISPGIADEKTIRSFHHSKFMVRPVSCRRDAVHSPGLQPWPTALAYSPGLQLCYAALSHGLVARCCSRTRWRRNATWSGTRCMRPSWRSGSQPALALDLRGVTALTTLLRPGQVVKFCLAAGTKAPIYGLNVRNSSPLRPSTHDGIRPQFLCTT